MWNLIVRIAFDENLGILFGVCIDFVVWQILVWLIHVFWIYVTFGVGNWKDIEIKMSV